MFLKYFLIFLILEIKLIATDEINIEKKISSLKVNSLISFIIKEKKQEYIPDDVLPPLQKLVLKREISTYGRTDILPKNDEIYKVILITSNKDSLPLMSKFFNNFSTAIMLKRVVPKLKENDFHFWFMDERGNIRQFEDAYIIKNIDDILKLKL